MDLLAYHSLLMRESEPGDNTMPNNVGTIDAALRILAGLALLGWGLYIQNEWSAVGFVPLLTGLFGWCPLYSSLGLSTRKTA